MKRLKQFLILLGIVCCLPMYMAEASSTTKETSSYQTYFELTGEKQASFATLKKKVGNTFTTIKKGTTIDLTKAKASIKGYKFTPTATAYYQLELSSKATVNGTTIRVFTKSGTEVESHGQTETGNKTSYYLKLKKNTAYYIVVQGASSKELAGTLKVNTSKVKSVKFETAPSVTTYIQNLGSIEKQTLSNLDDITNKLYLQPQALKVRVTYTDGTTTVISGVQGMWYYPLYGSKTWDQVAGTHTLYYSIYGIKLGVKVQVLKPSEITNSLQEGKVVTGTLGKERYDYRYYSYTPSTSGYYLFAYDSDYTGENEDGFEGVAFVLDSANGKVVSAQQAQENTATGEASYYTYKLTAGKKYTIAIGARDAGALHYSLKIIPCAGAKATEVNAPATVITTQYVYDKISPSALWEEKNPVEYRVKYVDGTELTITSQTLRSVSGYNVYEAKTGKLANTYFREVAGQYVVKYLCFGRKFSYPLQVKQGSRVDINGNRISLMKEGAVIYTGKPVKLPFYISYEGTELVEGVDYKATYSNNTKVGTATVRITGLRGYQGSRTLSFKIIPAASKITKAVSSKSKQVSIVWKKVTKADGYALILGTDVTATKNRKVVYVTNNKTTTKTISGLKKGETYYVKIKSYAVGNGKKVFSDVSASVKVKVR